MFTMGPNADVHDERTFVRTETTARNEEDDEGDGTKG